MKETSESLSNRKGLRAVSLHYANDAESGYSRVNTRSGFSYHDTSGKRITDAEGPGNRPAGCRRSYVHPPVVRAHREGDFADLWDAAATGEPAADATRAPRRTPRNVLVGLGGRVCNCRSRLTSVTCALKVARSCHALTAGRWARSDRL